MSGSPLIIDTVFWKNGSLHILDQSKLPVLEEYKELTSLESIIDAIKELKVRGAPAIGIAAAYGLRLVAVQTANQSRSVQEERLTRAARQLVDARPTAVNLKWAVDRIMSKISKEPSNLSDMIAQESDVIKNEDVYWNRQIGIYGQELLNDGDRILTHCNAGGLATSGYGTALGVIKMAVEKGKQIHVYVDETRPLLQGSRLTAWELARAGISYEILCDNAAASLMQSGRVSAVVVGADRIARNGDTANKIGTYGLAVLAKSHRIPFYVAAPSSTLDRKAASGRDIPIEFRRETEVTLWQDRPTAPKGARVYNPAFDVTPAALISAIVTERGVHRPEFAF
jgi:methylthioribose-1-phosphate isomerase